MKIVNLDNSCHIICPYCGEKIRWNDLLYAGKKEELLKDPVLSRYYLELLGNLPPYIKSRDLYCWRAFPTKQIVLKENLIHGIVSKDGTMMQDKVCPKCHNYIPESFIGKKITSVIGSQNMVKRWESDMIRIFENIKIELLIENTNIKIANLCGNLISTFHSDVDNRLLERREKLLIQNSQSLIIPLKLESRNKKEKCLDSGAVQSLNNTLDKLIHIRMIYKPVLFVLYTDDFFPMEEQKVIHRNMLDYIDNICQSSYELVFLSNNPEQIREECQEKSILIFQK